MKMFLGDRRAVIFYGFAILSLVLLIPCPTKFHFVGVDLAAVYFLLGTASWLDTRSRTRSRRRI